MSNRKLIMKKTNKELDNSDKQEFEKYLQKIEDPEYSGSDTSWALPKNATPVEKAKYELCEKILIYQQDNNLSDEEMANKIKLTTGETRDILYYHIDYFTLDRLINHATRLFKPLEIKVNYEIKKGAKAPHVSIV